LTTYTILGPQSLPAGAYYPLQDLLYRAVALTNSTGAIVEAYDTDAYGNTLIFTGPGADGVWFTDDDTQSSYGVNEIIYCGYRFDPESELYYVRNRSYNAVLGRWLQRDPIGYAGGVNLYEYVGGRAVVLPDPDGTVAIPIPRTLPQGIAEVILAAILAAYLLYLARQAAKVKCVPRKRERGCSFDDCYSGRPCGAEGSGRSCQWRIRIAEPFKNAPQCGCYAGGPGDEI
ncbi:MAG: RHS repeat-associated core domain-containing protein, partial [Candidatus Saccharimonadales bacterium]